MLIQHALQISIIRINKGIQITGWTITISHCSKSDLNAFMSMPFMFLVLAIRLSFKDPLPGQVECEGIMIRQA